MTENHIADAGEMVDQEIYPLPICYRCGKVISSGPDGENAVFIVTVERRGKTITKFGDVLIACSESCAGSGIGADGQEWVNEYGNRFFDNDRVRIEGQP